jgi:hypothetical protein
MKKRKRNIKVKKKQNNNTGIYVVFGLIVLIVGVYIYLLHQQISRQLEINSGSLQIIQEHQHTINQTKRTVRRLTLEQKRRVGLITKEIKQLSGSLYNSRYIAKQIIKYSSRMRYNPLLITSMIHHESNFRHTAKSRAGAIGLMQILPSTGKSLGYHPDSLLKIGYNIRAGIQYLKYLGRRFKEPRQILMAYNAGPTNVINNKIGQGTIRYANNIIIMKDKLEKKIG